MSHTQKHLSKIDEINLGSYYTDKKIVEMTYKMIQKNLKDFMEFTFLDNSCGYGEFINNLHNIKTIGADIDSISLQRVKSKNIFLQNALISPSRKKYDISSSEKLIIIGNPPYNDKTSQIKKNIKNISFEIDDDLKSRDLGISFLKSYVYLNPDYICILHPLSYLIKKTNFNSLKNFKENYRLKDGLIISSKYFTKGAEFPIIIGFYTKGNMDFDYTENFNFITEEGNSFKLKNFDFISNYLNKYPKKNPPIKSAGFFYTLRDINALKRNKTFLDKKIANAIVIERNQLPFYHYVNVFKSFANKLPYWCGNMEVFINKELFYTNMEDFINFSINPNMYYKSIEDYFNILFKDIDENYRMKQK